MSPSCCCLVRTSSAAPSCRAVSPSRKPPGPQHRRFAFPVVQVGGTALLSSSYRQTSPTLIFASVMATMALASTSSVLASAAPGAHDFNGVKATATLGMARSVAVLPKTGFSSCAVSGSVRLRHVVWVGQKSKTRTGALSSSSPVFVAAAATVVEEAAAPVVTTEAVPRPKKVGKGVVRLRLTRLGRKKRPFFRIVATHCSWRRDGKYIELLGHYNPLHAKADLGIVVKADRIKYWLGVGAQPSDTVTGILHKVGILKKEAEQ